MLVHSSSAFRRSSCMMRCHCRLLHPRMLPLSSFRLSALSPPETKNSRRCIHTSPLRKSTNPPTSTSITIQVVETPLKIASASGNTPPPEDPEEPRDHESSTRTDEQSKSPRNISTDSFARPTSRARGRPRGSSSRRGLKPARQRKTTVFKPVIPEWFMARNVVLHHHLQQSGVFGTQTPTSDPSSTTNETGAGSSPVPITRITISPYI